MASRPPYKPIEWSDHLQRPTIFLFLVCALGVVRPLPMAIGGFGQPVWVAWPTVVVRPPLVFLKYFLIFYYFSFKILINILLFFIKITRGTWISLKKSQPWTGYLSVHNELKRVLFLIKLEIYYSLTYSLNN